MDDAVYRKAKENIEQMLKSGVFREEEEPALYLYRQCMGDAARPASSAVQH